MKACNLFAQELLRVKVRVSETFSFRPMETTVRFLAEIGVTIKRRLTFSIIAAHEFTPPGPNDIRGPCPGEIYYLFTLWHSYLTPITRHECRCESQCQCMERDA